LEVLKGIFRGSLIFTTINLIIDFGELFMNRLIDYSSRFRILKGGKISLVVSALVGSVTLSFAAPSGGTVTTGSATITQNGSITNIDQSTNKASINWQSFNIGSNETVNFNQPSSSSITLNRVVGATSSLIQGAMNANGQVFLVNPNGVLFANGSQVNVAGLVATTKNITDEDFQNGNYNFDGDSTASILNQGTINATNGYVALLGKTVSNEGTITATLGNVQLAGGKRFSLQIDGNSLVNLTIDEAQLNSLVENKGAIIADGGKVHLTTQAVNDILDGMVNNTGVIEANSLSTNENGEVILFAHGGTANIDGTLKADFVETSGKIVKIAESTTVDTDGGEWLIDPVDFTIAAAGGDMTGATLSSNLGSNSVTIQSTSGASGTDGDINVNDAITWTSGNTLTLNSQGDININENIDASGGSGGKLVLEYGQGAVANSNTASYNILLGKTVSLQAGQNFDTKLGSDGSTINWEVITSLGSAGDESSAGISGNISLQNLTNTSNVLGYFVLGSNIDATDTANWNSGAGFVPIGYANDQYGFVNGNYALIENRNFKGSFDGLGHTISDLTASNNGYAGLFGLVEFNAGNSIKNLILSNVDIKTSGDYVGGIIGQLKGDSDSTTIDIENIHVTGISTVTDDGSDDYYYYGGLIGSASDVNIKNVSSTADVSNSEEWIGGIVGELSSSTLTQAYATGTITDSSNSTYDGIGGLVGEANRNSIISLSYATGNVNASHSDHAGGLVGIIDSSTVINSYATGNVIGIDDVGGFAGKVSNSILTNNYSIGTVTGNSNIGGFVGFKRSGNTFTNNYWDTTTSNETNSYYDEASSSYVTNISGEVEGKITSDLKSLLIMQNSNTNWNIVGDDSLSNVYPQLRWATDGLSAGSSVWVIGKVGLNYVVSGGTKTYGEEFTLPTPSITGGTPSATPTVKVYDGTTDVTAQAVAGTLPVGTYTVKTLLTDNTYKLDTSGNTDGTLTIGQANLNYTVAGGTKTYGEVFTLPTPSITGGTPSATPTVKVYDGTTDVTAQAIAGTLPVGTYTVKTELTDTNYAIANSGNTDGTLTIGQASVNYTVSGGTKTYGEGFTLPTPSITGGTPSATPTVKVYDGETDVTSQAVAGTLAAGTYTVKVTLNDTNYIISTTGNTDGTLTINSAIEIQDIITNIVNATTVKPPVVSPKTPEQPIAGFERKVASAIVNNTPAITTDNTLPSENIGLNELIRDVKPEVNDVVQNNRLTLVSDSGGEEKITTVDMESLMAKSGGGELRVALSPDSFVELVNGGVNLPSGVSQEFYVVEDQQ
jgi:filamentous hemagglutinin family protein